MTMISNMIKFGSKHLRTIVSNALIKPSSPTPSHLKTHNLSLIDQVMVNTFIPIVTFYPNTGTGIYPSSYDKTPVLKKSLSQTLTKYYPFAGRIAKFAPSFVDCNDHGAEFLEASIDSTLSHFLQNSQHEDLDQLFPHGLVNDKSNRPDDDLQSDGVAPLAVQVNHFECGGIALATSFSHKLADGRSFTHFLNDWAKITKHEIPDDPQFIPNEYKNLNFNGLSLDSSECVTRSFIFPNEKINDLKLKVKPMITNPTRVEVLTWLLYKCAETAAAKSNPGSYKPFGVGHQLNIRGRLMEQLPEKSIGNFFVEMEILKHNEREMNLESFISRFRKQKMLFQSIRNIQTVFGMVLEISLEEIQKTFESTYLCSSICGYGVYDIDFGWGKPVKAILAGNIRKNSFLMMDAPNRDGIEVFASLGKQEMDIFQTNPELLAFC